MSIENDVSMMNDNLKKIENREGLSLDQRLEIYILNQQMGVLSFHLSWLYSPGELDEQSIISDEERLRQSIVYCQAALLSLDRLERLFVGVPRKYRGRTFTEEMFARSSQDRVEAEKQLVDIRRKLRS